MDIKTHILRLERRVEENPAELVLWIIGALAVIFIGIVFFDAYRKKKERNRRKR